MSSSRELSLRHGGVVPGAKSCMRPKRAKTALRAQSESAEVKRVRLAGIKSFNHHAPEGYAWLRHGGKDLTCLLSQGW